ncbi:transcriptional regulator, TetR family [Anaerovirgula multivorans]|uniref:Transcriptional regulator, TetR family n=1 Tax=Anaerovirgula multivorans TaxID=312168 RepID=A0A239C2G0_9FIRM|nr:TetR/AcrR family transcriptional regulator [Anaerovirgula multivorans]SNS13821.1 transcriptional regulator, TetR family [Anaerovirgula multivorans]
MVVSLLHRKERIILSTIEVINELGIQGLSTREIAKREGISEGTIFKHFQSKNQLLLAVLDYYSQYDSDIVKSINLKNLEPIDAILYFVDAYATYYESYPAITVISQSYDVLSYNPKLTNKIKDIFLGRIKTMETLVKEGQTLGEIHPNADAEKLASMILGSFRIICLKWRMEEYKFPLKEYILSALKMLLDEFITEPHEKNLK